MKIDLVSVRRATTCLLSVMLAAVCAGCGQNGSQSGGQAAPELEQARAENQEVQKLRRENQELARLRKDHDEVGRLRGEINQLPNLRQENEQLRAQLAPGGKPGMQRPATTGTTAAPPAPLNPQLAATEPGAATNESGVNPADLPQEGDEILIETRLLGKLLPEFDWSKVERKEPVAIKGLLDQKGIVLTNYQQLVELGITNYVIQRKPPEQPPQ